MRYLTAGESHGPQVTAILEGLPAGLEISKADIDLELKRRQAGYGRGGRMKIESDEVDVVSGLRFGRTLGSPLAMVVRNRDWENWKDEMDPYQGPPPRHRAFTRPRPGHADLAGGMKYGHEDLRNVLERASARETAARVAVGAVVRQLLARFGIDVLGCVVEIGGERARDGQMTPAERRTRAEASEVRVYDAEVEGAIKAKIDEARRKGETLGGVFEVVVLGAPPGLGSHVHWDRKLDARIALALLSIQAVKGVEFGLGFDCARRPGSEVHDEIGYDPGRPWGFFRTTNRGGGIEGGMSTGEEIVVRGVMKPLSTLMKPLASVDIRTKEPFRAQVERSDVCAVPAAAVVAEAVVAFEVAAAFVEKFGGDSMEEIGRNYEGYRKALREYGLKGA
ncbi:MAG: chorismate synthase [Nitrospirae bacterium]|nr:chorismate synthase [Nitrospirota bacterium]